jgi:hypothetical protein
MLAQNSYDLVLMSEPVFQSIPLTPDREYDNYQEIMGNHISDSSAANKKKGYDLEKRKQTFMAKLSDRRVRSLKLPTGKIWALIACCTMKRIT